MTLYSHDWSKSDSAHSQDFSFYTGDITLGLNISVILSNDILEWPLYILMLFCVLYSYHCTKYGYVHIVFMVATVKSTLNL